MVCQLAAALADRGFRVYLISLDSDGALAFYPLHHAVQWIRLGFNPGIADKLRRTGVLARLLKDNDVQVLVGFVMSGDKTVFAAAKYSGVRLVVAERNAPSMYRLRYTPIQRWMNLGLLHLADRITVQMPGFVAGYPARLRGRIETIPNPVPTVSRLAHPDLPNEAGRFTLLAVSRMDGVQKRLDCLIRAFARIASNYPAWDLRIIGDGPEEAALHQLVHACGLADRVQIEPAIASIFDVYVQAHLFAIPSLWEGFPNALAEALCHGLPAVGFAEAAGVAELIGDSGGGWLAKGLDDEAALSSTLGQAMGDADERMRRGGLAAQGMTAFAPEAQFDRWAALLKSQVAEHAR